MSLAIGYICTDLNYRSLLETGIKCVMYSHLIIESFFQYWVLFFTQIFFSCLLYQHLMSLLFLLSPKSRPGQIFRAFMHMNVHLNQLPLKIERKEAILAPSSCCYAPSSNVNQRLPEGGGVLSKVRMSTEKSNVATYIEF